MSLFSPASFPSRFPRYSTTYRRLKLSQFRKFNTSCAMSQEFQLKGISSLSELQTGHKQAYGIEGLENANVLLVKSFDKVHALSPKCTHYGAPLAKGVLHGNRLTCPWHGACFNITTGNVEDAPALDPLARFEISERDGKVYIRGDAGVVKNSFPESLSIKCSIQGREKVVVIGGGSGSLGAVEGLRTGGYDGQLTLICSEGVQPIDRTKLSKALLADVGKLAWRKKEFYSQAGIDIVYDQATKIDFASRKITTKEGKCFDYTKLILATGSSPRWLPLDGLKGDLNNVFVLRTLSHVKDILAAVGDNGKRVVVIGSSFIGMEVANCLAGKKNTVTVVGMDEEPMQKVMGKQVGKIFRALLEKNGVEFKMSASVEKATPSSSDPSKVGAVVLKDGTRLEADLVIEGVGVSPETTYLKDNSAIHLLEDGSIEVDEKFAVNNLTDVYAIGDIATYPYHGPGGNGKKIRIEHWNVAQNAGRVVAQTIINPGQKPKFFTPVFWSALGQQLRYCGNTVGGYDDVVINGETNPEKPSFVAYYTSGQTVVAVATMGKDPVMVQCAALMADGKMPSKNDLQNGVDVLTIQ